MHRKIEIIVNNSELTAGTRGASLGPGAIMTAARKANSPYFGLYPLHPLPDLNHFLDRENETEFAKNIIPYKQVFESVATKTQSVIEKGSFPIILAGDHGSAAGTIAGIKAAFPNKRLGVIWIDAHGDLHSPYTTPSGNMHGMPLSLSLGNDNLGYQRNTPSEQTIQIWNELKFKYTNASKVNPSDLIFIGVRDTEHEEDQLIAENNITNHTVEAIRKDGAPAIVTQTLKQLEPCDIIYVSFDVDSMDPEITSFGTGTPVGNGIFPEEAEEILTLLAKNPKTVCIEFVEVNPCLDNKINVMAETAFSLLEKVSAALNS
ncbi:arginase [Fluviicola taffensis]|uniref:Arginase n=1 Tax=Fluviicola taffensis (strain DSM 16823 / NCIMB 13979 / RW262) TaxID=755732 RepID=F2IFR6_FLUTR|nr:arginase [Fluviicola taffensis]AEA42524.1 Arginase [Fluviicola taffensis DSM 16823]